MHRARVLGTLLSITLCALAARPTPVFAHPSALPAFQVEYDLQEEELVLTVLLNAEDARAVLRLTRLEATRKNQVPAGVLKATVQLVAEGRIVKVDGIFVAPILVSGETGYPEKLAEQFEQSAGSISLDVLYMITFRYALKTQPKRISITWTDERAYEANHPLLPGRAKAMPEPQGVPVKESDNQPLKRLRVGLWVGMKCMSAILTAEEPEYIWHAPTAPPRHPVVPVEAEASGFRLRLTLSSLIVVLLYPAAVVLLLRRTRGVTVCAALFPIACGLFLAAAAYGPVSLVASRSALPEEKEAVDIFSTLHANIYRAFDYDNEDDIYDTLSQSVARSMLYEIYADVYESLIMRQQGGAMCTVDQVDTLSSEYLGGVEGDTPSFRVSSHWRVSGTVAHWGHIHKRVNEYKALYTVARVQGAWKIVGTKVTMQNRVDSDSE